MSIPVLLGLDCGLGVGVGVGVWRGCVCGVYAVCACVTVVCVRDVRVVCTGRRQSRDAGLSSSVLRRKQTGDAHVKRKLVSELVRLKHSDGFKQNESRGCVRNSRGSERHSVHSRGSVRKSRGSVRKSRGSERRSVHSRGSERHYVSTLCLLLRLATASRARVAVAAAGNVSCT